MSCKSSRSQMFLKIDVLRNFASFARKHLCWSLFLIKLQAKLLRTRSFAEHLQWLLMWFLQQNYLIFSVITITLGYKQKLSWKYCNYYHPPYIKISISYQKYAHLVQKFCSLSHQSPNFLILSSIYFCIISIFLRGSGVSHTYAVSLIEGLSKIDCPIYQEENSPLPQKCSWPYSLVIKVHLKFIMLIKTSAVQSGLQVDILCILFLSDPWF